VFAQGLRRVDGQGAIEQFVELAFIHLGDGAERLASSVFQGDALLGAGSRWSSRSLRTLLTATPRSSQVSTCCTREICSLEYSRCPLAVRMGTIRP
jgi:hypothetical protein